MHNTVNRDRNDVLSPPTLLRDWILIIPTTKKKCQLCDLIEVLTNVTMAIILQYLNVPNQHVVHLKLTLCYVSNRFQTSKQKRM